MTVTPATSVVRRSLLASILLIASVGCTPFPGTRYASTPHPQTGAAATVEDSVTTMRPDASTVAQVSGAQRSGNRGEVIRGQGGGFSLPPSFEAAADGGRHSRTPLPVSGAAQTQLAQNPLPAPQPSGGNNAPGQSYQSNQAPSGMAPAPPSLPGSDGYGSQPLPGPQSGSAVGSPSYGSPVPTSPPIGVMPQFNDPSFGSGLQGSPAPYVPQTNVADVYIQGTPGRTGRVMLGGAVNSDAGVTGQFTIDERNFDITRWPSSFQELFSGTAFRGRGQTFRLEAAPGQQFQRYTVQFADPNLFGYLPISSNVSGFYYDRRFQDWDESRLGGRLALGYRLTPDLSLSTGLKAQSVEMKDLRITGIPELDRFVGQHALYSGEFRLAHDTRETPFGASQGHFLQWTFEQTFGDFNYPRAELDFRRYFLIRQRADGSGKHTLTMSTQFGVSGSDTPVFENFFAGGYSTIRGFEFRGASPTIGGAQVGGRMSWLNSVEYMFPITADDAFRAVTFVDFGTVERDFDVRSDNFRVAPGVGFRFAIPALGPAPLAFDFAFPVSDAAGDERQVFSFYMSAAR